MPVKSGFSSFFDELIDQAGKIYIGQEEIKQRKAQLKQQQDQLEINAATLQNQVNRARVDRFRTMWSLAGEEIERRMPKEETQPKETTVRYIYEGLPGKGGGGAKVMTLPATVAPTPEEQASESMTFPPDLPDQIHKAFAENDGATISELIKKYGSALVKRIQFGGITK